MKEEIEKTYKGIKPIIENILGIYPYLLEVDTRFKENIECDMHNL